MNRVVIAGATGYLGRHLLQAFKKANYEVVVLARNPKKLTHYAAYIDHLHIVDLMKEHTYKDFIKEDDLVVSTVGITRQKDGLTYMDVDYGVNHGLLEVALEAKASKFMYISALKGDTITQIKIAHAKEKFVKELEASPIAAYIMRPTGFFVDVEEIFNMAKKGRVFQFGHGQYKSNPIHGEDLASFCVETVDREAGCYEVGGPEVYSTDELAKLAFEALGKKAKITNIPEWTAKLVKWLLTHFTKQTFYGPFEFFLTVMCMDMVGPSFGQISIKDHYKKLAAKL